MDLAPADCVLLAMAAVMAIFGGFSGFSGILAFGSAVALAVFSLSLMWPFAIARFETPWAAALAVFIAAILVFAIVRFAIKKTVRVVVSQPSDSIFGMVFGLVLAAGIVFAWAKTGLLAEHSAIVTWVSAYVR